MTPTEGSSEGLLRLQVRVTVAFVLLTVATVLASGSIDIAYVVVSVCAFAFGFVAFCVGFWNGLQRSKDEEVTLVGLLSLSSSHVAKHGRNTNWMAIAVQITAAVAGASLRLFTLQAFGLLVPMLGLGLATLYASRSAHFHPREHR